MDKLAWCKKQKSGIKIREPSENISKEYIKKAENSLSAVQSLKDNPEWRISSAYYAMYFSLYAILMRIGIKCEIHSCTIEIVKTVLSDFFTKEDIQLLHNSLSARIDVQYYVDRFVDADFQSEMIEKAPKIHVKCIEILTQLSESDIHQIRKRLQ